MFYQHLLERLAAAWGVLEAYPDLFIAAVIATAVGVWWLRSQIGKAEVNGLNARIGALEERLRLAGDKFQLLAGEKARLEEQVLRLDAQIEDKMPVYALVETSAAAVSSLNRLDQLEKEVGASLAPMSQPGRRAKSGRSSPKVRDRATAVVLGALAAANARCGHAHELSASLS